MRQSWPTVVMQALHLVVCMHSDVYMWSTVCVLVWSGAGYYRHSWQGCRLTTHV